MPIPVCEFRDNKSIAGVHPNPTNHNEAFKLRKAKPFANLMQKNQAQPAESLLCVREELKYGMLKWLSITVIEKVFLKNLEEV